MNCDPTALEWVLTWAGTIALLRAIGHALVNDDAKKDARLEKAQRVWWDKLKAAKPNPSIFWEFIERDRNLLLNVPQVPTAEKKRAAKARMDALQRQAEAYQQKLAAHRR